MGGNHGSYGDHRRLRHKASMSFACTALLGMSLMSLDDGDDGDSANLWPFFTQSTPTYRWSDTPDAISNEANPGLAQIKAGSGSIAKA